MGSCLSIPETDAERDQAQIEARLRLLEMGHANMHNAALWGEHHRALTMQEDAKYNLAQKNWQIQQSLANPNQASYAQQTQRAATAPHSQSLQRNACMSEPSAPPLPFPMPGRAKPRKSTDSGPSKVPTKQKAKHRRGSETYAARLAASNVSFEEWTPADYVREKHCLARKVAENVEKLFKKNDTLAFIASYRKNLTSGMNADELRNVKCSYDAAPLIKQKANCLVQEVDKQGNWTAEFHIFVHTMKNPNDLQEIHSILNSREAKLAERFKIFGLGATSRAIINGQTFESLNSLVKPGIEGLRTEEQVKNSILCVLGDTIIKDETTFREIQTLRSKHAATIETTELKDTTGDANEPDKRRDQDPKYRYFYDFSSSVDNLKPHQILDMNRGQTLNILIVKVNVPADFETDFKKYCERRYGAACNASPRHKILLTAAFDSAWYKLIKPSVCRQTRVDLNERALIGATDDIVKNVRNLFLTPPVTGKIVIGIHPGFHQGCQLAVVSERSQVLRTETIRPHDTDNRAAKHEAQRVLAAIVLAHKCTILALGNGAAARETEIFLADLIAKRTFAPINVVYTIVEEAEVSIYANSQEASSEFPGLDTNVLAAIFIARFVQDPMAELVKIEPQHLRVGMYKNRLPHKQWIETVNQVITETVSFVGVDVNTAQISLLRRVAGLNESKAKNIIEWRKTCGPFRTRNDLKKVRGVCAKTFEQCAGFIRIKPETIIDINKGIAAESLDYFDQTCIHPEFYTTARAFLTAANCNPSQIGTKPFISAVKLFASQGYSPLAKKFSTNVETMKMIVEALTIDKGLDIRGERDASAFRKSIMSINELRIGNILTGVVRNHASFGAFVNVGLERDGLIHVSKMGGVALPIGQRVEAKVNNVEKERGRIGLTLVKCI